MNSSQNPQMEALIRLASNAVGQDPAKVREAVEGGKLDALMTKLKPADAARLQQILQNPKLAEQLLASPQARELLRRFLK